MSISRGRKTSKKRKIYSSKQRVELKWVSIRPDSDDVAEIYGGAHAAYLSQQELIESINIGSQFDVLCRDGLHYMSKVVDISGRHIKLHFPGWGPKYDFTGDLYSLYLAPIKLYSGECGILPNNRYKMIQNNDTNMEQDIKEKQDKTPKKRGKRNGRGNWIKAKRKKDENEDEDEIENWIQCDGPQCRRWHMVPIHLNVNDLLSRADGQWFCHMNTWDGTTPFCDIKPQIISSHSSSSSSSGGDIKHDILSHMNYSHNHSYSSNVDESFDTGILSMTTDDTLFGLSNLVKFSGRDNTFVDDGNATSDDGIESVSSYGGVVGGINVDEAMRSIAKTKVALSKLRKFRKKIDDKISLLEKSLDDKFIL
jgi:hypothetical protein